MDRAHLISQKGLDEYFFQQVRSAISNQNLDTNPHTEFYLVRLLSSYCQSDRLYPDEESRETPLAIRYLQTLQLQHLESIRVLQDLADFTLYITGFFQESLQRSNVDIDYYFSLGRNAYQRLHSLGERSQTLEAFRDTYWELSSQFPSYAEVLCEISEVGLSQGDANLLKLYERWLETGSLRILKKLQKAGIDPLPRNDSKH